MPTTRIDPEEARGLRLGRTIRVTAWWLLVQGVLCLGLNSALARYCDLRFDGMLEPYLRLAGLSLVCLGFFLMKALRDPRRQYLAVDVLILFLLGHVYFLLDYRLNAQMLTPWEWVWGAADLALSVSLVLNRTRSSKMEGETTVFSARATDLARQTGQWVARKGPPPTASLGELAPAGESAEAEATTKAAEAENAGRRGESEVIPHMD